MRPLAFASATMLAFGFLVLVAHPAAACPAPTSGTGLATCQGDGSTVQPTLTEGPVCWNALCPGVTSEPADATCANVFSGGNPLFESDLCVPVSLKST